MTITRETAEALGIAVCVAVLARPAISRRSFAA